MSVGPENTALTKRGDIGNEEKIATSENEEIMKLSELCYILKCSQVGNFPVNTQITKIYSSAQA